MTDDGAVDDPRGDGSGTDEDSVGCRRRRYLGGLTGVAASTALAGCGSIIESVFEGLGEAPFVTIEDERVVQTVEKTEVAGASGSPTELDDPRLVEEYDVAPVFGLSGQNLDQLTDLRIEVDVDGGGSTTFDLPGGDVEDIDAGADPAAVFTDAASASNTPTVTLAPGAASITVDAIEPDSGATLDSVSLVAGGDFTRVESDALRVGFVDVQDPDNGSNFGGGNNGEVVDFARDAQMAHRYLVATYPGGVMSFAYEDGTITGDPDDRHDDYSSAYTTLQKAAKGNHSSRPNFPNGGTFRNDSHLSDSDAESSIKSNGFDVTVLILPDDYYGDLGLHPGSRKKAVSTLEPEANGSAWDEAEFTHTVAQEIGHNLLSDPYTDPSEHPLAQRASKGSDATDGSGNDVDRDHARHENSQGGSDGPGVTSVGYDFTNGEFATIDSTEFDNAGAFSIGGSFGVGSSRSIERLESFMSYSWSDVWTDARMLDELIDSNFQRANWGSATRRVLSARGRVTETGAVRFDDVRTFEGRPYLPDLEAQGEGADEPGDADGDEGTETGESQTDGETTEQEDDKPPGREEEGEPEPTGEAVELVDVALLDPDGEPLVTAHVPDRVQPLHADEVVPEAEVLVAFPMRTVAVESERVGEQSRFNPITRVVGDAVGRIPDRGFVEDPAQVREAIEAALGLVDDRMGEQAYGEAAEVMDTRVRGVVSQGVRGEYQDAGSNQPFRADVLSLVDRMVERLEGLPAAEDPPEETTGEWVTFQGDNARTGLATGIEGPGAAFAERWRVETSDTTLASPVVTDGVVYVGDDAGLVFALAAGDGSQEWVAQTDDVIRAAPAVGEELVYVPTRAGSLYAFDAASGEERWRFGPDEGIENLPGALSSPAVSGDVVVYATPQGTLYAVDAAAGEEVWRVPFQGDVYASPAVADGVVYVASTNGRLRAVDVDSGEVRWEQFVEGGVQSTPTVANGAVYVTASGGIVSAFGDADGEIRWQQGLENADVMVSSPVATNDMLYVGSGGTADGEDVGSVHALAIGDGGQGGEVWRRTWSDHVLSSPVATNDMLYVGGGDGNVYAVSPDDGSTQDRFDTGGEGPIFDDAAGSPAVVDDALFTTAITSSESGDVFALEGAEE